MKNHLPSAIIQTTLFAGTLFTCCLVQGGNPSGNSITIYAAGDIAECKNLLPTDTPAAKTAALIATGLAKDPAAAVLTLGDNTYPIGLPGEFNECYDPTWGQFKTRTYPGIGNHEYYTPAAMGYFGYFGARAGLGRRAYYSFDLGRWHLISLNSNLKADELAQQLEWLQRDLQEHKNGCTLAYWHHPVFSSGGHGNNPQMRDAWKLLYAAKAELVLSSHDHDYERFAPQDDEGLLDLKLGIREFVVGTGGAQLSIMFLRKVNSEASDNGSHGVLKLVLKDGGYDWEFIPVGKNGFRDQGSGQCH